MGSGPYAIWRPGDAAVAAALLDRGASPRQAAHNGWTPLHSAAQAPDGGGELVTLLLDGGAPIDAPDAVGWTPLHHAARLDALDVARVLVARGASLGARTAEARAVRARAYPAGATPLDVARVADARRVVTLLAERP
jgi:ankyrin repeat protein